MIIMGKEKLIPIFAIIVLLIGTFSTVYVYATQTNAKDEKVDADTITICDKQYSIEQLFSIVEPRTFDSLNFSGVALDDLIMKAGVDCPACHEYTIMGEDGYQKTVTWENMNNGLLTQDKMVVFTDLPKAFRIKNVVKIEVI